MKGAAWRVGEGESGREGLELPRLADVIDHAMTVARRARFLRVLGSGEWVAEIPGAEWTQWALGKTQEEALKALTTRIAKQMARGLGVRLSGREEAAE